MAEYRFDIVTTDDPDHGVSLFFKAAAANFHEKAGAIADRKLAAHIERHPDQRDTAYGDLYTNDGSDHEVFLFTVESE